MLILAGGFSDPSTWARGRLKSTVPECVVLQRRLASPKRRCPVRQCPMSHAAPRRARPRSSYQQKPGLRGRARLEVRAACCTAAGSECHAGVTSSSQRSKTERGEGGGQQTRQAPDCSLARLGRPQGPNPDGKPHRALDRQRIQIPSPSGRGKRIDNVSVSNGTARITVYIQKCIVLLCM